MENDRFDTHAQSKTIMHISRHHYQVHRGTVFQHTDWVHKQNLMVARTVIVKLKPGETGTHTSPLGC